MYGQFTNGEFFWHKVGKYSKNNKEIFNVLLSIGNPQNAIANAKKIEEFHSDKNPAESVPCTTVHKLVESLAVYLPEDIKCKFIIN